MLKIFHFVDYIVTTKEFTPKLEKIKNTTSWIFNQFFFRNSVAYSIYLLLKKLFYLLKINVCYVYLLVFCHPKNGQSISRHSLMIFNNYRNHVLLKFENIYLIYCFLIKLIVTATCFCFMSYNSMRQGFFFIIFCIQL